MKRWEAENIQAMKKLRASDDNESAHLEADRILCELLVKLGYKKLVDEYEEVPKWYA